MDTSSIQHLVQAGAVGISIALIFLIYKIYERCSQSTDNIIDVVRKNAEAMTHLKDSIDVNTDATKNMSDGLRSMSDVARDAMKLKKRVKIKKYDKT